MAGLEQGVFDKAQPGFLGVIHAQAGLGNHFDPGRGQQTIEFGQFAGIAAGQDKLFHGAGSSRSQVLPYRSVKIATVPCGSCRGASVKRTPRAVIAAWSRAKSSVCRKKPTRPPVWSPIRDCWLTVL